MTSLKLPSMNYLQSVSVWVQSEEKQHFTIIRTLSCCLNPVLLGKTSTPTSPFTHRVNSYIPTVLCHNTQRKFPVVVSRIMQRKKPCCPSTWPQERLGLASRVEQMRTYLIGDVTRQCPRGDGREIGRLRHFKSPDDGGRDDGNMGVALQ